jgi:hypothetical protein
MLRMGLDEGSTQWNLRLPPQRGPEAFGDVGDDLHVVLVVEREGQSEDHLPNFPETGVGVEGLCDLLRTPMRSRAKIIRAGPCGVAVRSVLAST